MDFEIRFKWTQIRRFSLIEDGEKFWRLAKNNASINFKNSCKVVIDVINE